MIPMINLKETGIRLRRLVDARGLSAKTVQTYLGLASVQSVYNWFNGINMPTIDNLYALSQLLGVSIDEMICGDRRFLLSDGRSRRVWTYYNRTRFFVPA